VQDYGDASIAAAFLIPQDCDKYYLVLCHVETIG
jgi:hypothetical protein